MLLQQVDKFDPEFWFTLQILLLILNLPQTIKLNDAKSLAKLILHENCTISFSIHNYIRQDSASSTQSKYFIDKQNHRNFRIEIQQIQLTGFKSCQILTLYSRENVSNFVDLTICAFIQIRKHCSIDFCMISHILRNRKWVEKVTKKFANFGSCLLKTSRLTTSNIHTTPTTRKAFCYFFISSQKIYINSFYNQTFCLYAFEC